MPIHSLALPSGKSFQFSHYGLRFDGELKYNEWEQIINALHCVKQAYHCSLGDMISYGARKFGDAKVAATLEQMEFEMADVAKATAIGTLAIDFRETHELSAEHYFVLSKIEEPARTKWAKLASKNHLSALELKRSVEAGAILRLSQIQSESGQGSGITTIQGVVFKLQQWEKAMGGSAGILSLPPKDRGDLLELLTPAVALAAKLEESLLA